MLEELGSGEEVSGIGSLDGMGEETTFVLVKREQEESNVVIITAKKKDFNFMMVVLSSQAHLQLDNISFLGPIIHMPCTRVSFLRLDCSGDFRGMAFHYHR